MSLPLASTTVTVRRSTGVANADDYDAAVAPATLTSGLRAHLSSPTGRATQDAGAGEAIDRLLYVDVTDLQRGDAVVDAATAATWHVVWVQRVAGVGLDHMVAGVVRTTETV